jgi:hypothetical protein
MNSPRSAAALFRAAHLFQRHADNNANHPEAIMPKLTIIAFDGTHHDLDVQNGSTVMENAVRNSIPGIEAECGGACACATCHVYVDDAW